jgi:hypothetical protein
MPNVPDSTDEVPMEVAPNDVPKEPPTDPSKEVPANVNADM